MVALCSLEFHLEIQLRKEHSDSKTRAPWARCFALNCSKKIVNANLVKINGNRKHFEFFKCKLIIRIDTRSSERNLNCSFTSLFQIT